MTAVERIVERIDVYGRVQAVGFWPHVYRLATELGVDGMGQAEVYGTRQVLALRQVSPRASSAGRLFDAASALLGICDTVSYEGEAAVLLEAASVGHPDGEPLDWALRQNADLWVYDPVPTLRHLLRATADESTGAVAARFHTTIAEVTAALAERAAKLTGTQTVCLGGGVFQNRRLLIGVLDRLRAADLCALVSEQVPVNDGGISYGQAAVAAARLGTG